MGRELSPDEMKRRFSESDAKRAFTSQRAEAKKRGIGWEFTFDEWLQWWGNDIARRGRGASDLQMQRIADSGPYRPDNVRKARPAENRKTHKIMVRNEKVAAAGVKHQEMLDTAPVVNSVDNAEDTSDDGPNLGYQTMYGRIERQAVRTCDWDEPLRKPSVGWYDE